MIKRSIRRQNIDIIIIIIVEKNKTLSITFTFGFIENRTPTGYTVIFSAAAALNTNKDTRPNNYYDDDKERKYSNTNKYNHIHRINIK